MARILYLLVITLQVIHLSLQGSNFIRLVPKKSGSPNGRLEVCINKTSASDCADSDYLRLSSSSLWSHEATAACKELGYSGGDYGLESSHFDHGDSRAYYGYYDCPRSSTKLTTCNLRTQSISTTSKSEASVYCYKENGVHIFYYGRKWSFSNGWTRPYIYGFLAVYKSNKFQYVLQDGWDDTDATVACKEIGYAGGYAYTGRKFWYTTGSRGPFMYNIACTGSESSLISCTHATKTSYSTNDYAGILCYDTPPTPGFSDIRLMNIKGRIGTYHGEVQLKYDGIWGRVCDSSKLFSTNNADVLCKQIGTGFVGGWPRTGGPINRHGHMLPSWIDRPVCTGSESKLGDCPNQNNVESYQQCTYVYTQAAGAVCYYNFDTEDKLTLSLENYGYSYYGDNYLYAYWRGVKGTITDYPWTVADANVSCHMLNYTYGYPVQGYNRRGNYGYGEPPTLLEGIECTGTEEHLSECTRTKDFGQATRTHQYDMGVWCSNNYTQLTNSHIRLYGTDATTQYGAVQVNMEGLWGNICYNSNWREEEATVVCKQLGYNFGIGGPDFDGSRHPLASPMWMANVACTGNEAAIWNCSFSGWGQASPTSCYTNNHEAGVLCYNQEITIELLQSTHPRAGVVIMTVDGVEGTLSDSSWDNNEARQVCMLFGPLPSTRQYRRASYKNYGRGPGRVWLAQAYCNNNAKDLFNCNNQGWGQSTSGYNAHNNDAGVICVDGHMGNIVRTAPSGTFMSYRHYYSNYYLYTRYLKINVPDNHRVKVTFDIFELESDWMPGCSDFNDTLKIYDGHDTATSTLITSLCGRDYLPPPVVSTANKIMLYFENDGDTDYNNKGFSGYWQAECLGITIWEKNDTSGNTSHNLKKYASINSEYLCHVECDKQYPRCNETVFDTDNNICYLFLQSYYTTKPGNLNGVNVITSRRACEIPTTCSYGGTPSLTPTTNIHVLNETSIADITRDECIFMCLQLQTCTHVVYDATKCIHKSGDNFVAGPSTSYKIECQYAPNITKDAADSVVHEGSNIDIEMVVDLGVPAAQVTWYKGSTPITAGGRIQIVNTASVAKLTVLNCVGSDAGQYKLKLVNLKGQSEATVTESIYLAPKFPSTPTNPTANVGSPATLSVVIDRGYPVATVTWFRGSTEIESDADYTISIQATLTTLTIAQTNETTDAGQYKVKMVNVVANAEQTVSLTLVAADGTTITKSELFDPGSADAQSGSGSSSDTGSDTAGGFPTAMVAGVVAGALLLALLALIVGLILRKRKKTEEAKHMKTKEDKYTDEQEKEFESRPNSIAPSVTTHPEFNFHRNNSFTLHS